MVELFATTEDGRAWLEKANSKIDEYMETKHNEAKEAEMKTKPAGLSFDSKPEKIGVD